LSEDTTTSDRAMLIFPCLSEDTTTSDTSAHFSPMLVRRYYNFAHTCSFFTFACPKILQLWTHLLIFHLCLSEDTTTSDRAMLIFPCLSEDTTTSDTPVMIFPSLVRRYHNFGQSNADFPLLVRRYHNFGHTCSFFIIACLILFELDIPLSLNR